MTEKLEAAIVAYRAARDRLPQAEAEAAALIADARARVEQTRADLAAAMVSAAKAGRPQVEIIRLTGYSRERVRSILRAGGVGP